LTWAVKVTEEYAEWFTARLNEDLDSAAQRDNVPIAERLQNEYTAEDGE
jgi:hypothetical protein